MFKNAYFGKAYKIEDGKKAIYLQKCNSTGLHELITSNIEEIECTDSGLYVEDDTDNNIVSEWQDSIDEKERDRLANKEYDTNYSNGEYCHKQSFLWGFQEGYQKALE